MRVLIIFIVWVLKIIIWRLVKVIGLIVSKLLFRFIWSGCWFVILKLEMCVKFFIVDLILVMLC